MSKKDEAIRAAVEALQGLKQLLDIATSIGAVPPAADGPAGKALSALSLLRSAMEEGEEPVACMVDNEYGVMLWPISDIHDARLYCDDGEEPIPLYASPIAADTEDKRDAELWRKLKPMYYSAHFFPEDMDLPKGVALIFLAPEHTRVSADLDSTVAAMKDCHQ